VRAFLVVQAIGVLGILLYLLFRESVAGSAAEWLTLLALFPGSLLGSWSVERILWPSITSRAAIQTLSVVAGIALNAVVWALFARLRSAFRRDGSCPVA
jgi:hypothetical protein